VRGPTFLIDLRYTRAYILGVMSEQALGARIAAARKRAGLSQMGLATRLEVTVTTVSRWENDQCEIRPITLRGIESVLGPLEPGQSAGEAAPDGSAESAEPAEPGR
jgi:transcriptional regulator with XRE-family HTH domain